MSDDVETVRKWLKSAFESIDGEWGCCHSFEDMTEKCVGRDVLEQLASLDRIAARLEATEAALRFYADPETYLTPPGYVLSTVEADAGARALAALDKETQG